ncbi:acyl-CoA dehydrogenase family protein [Streptomyces sp. NPDC049590]|uniref:acyl-CoA dehydrogenase family protein n=1 Tax=Streptomyces sp. NPDC049590 TaxID=3154834 RepID=UPI00341958F6
MEAAPGTPAFPYPFRAGPFRRRVRAWISASVPPGLTVPGRPAAHAEWERRLLGAGLVCPAWPRRYGGAGLGVPEVLVLEEECARAGVPRIGRGTGELVVGPVLLAHGTEEQRARLLPGIRSGRDTYCQAYAEPSHGSDPASVRTRGTVVGDEIVISGRKTWVHGARRAGTALVLCRTDPAAERHRGLSCVAVRLDEGNGTRVRPVRSADGTQDLCEVEFDGARAPLRDVVGGLGGGWPVVMTALAHQRAGRALASLTGFEAAFRDLVREAQKAGRTRDPLVRDQLARTYTRLALLRLTVADPPAAGAPGAGAAVTGLLRAEYRRRFGETALAVTGAAGLLGAGPGEEAGDPAGRWQRLFLSGRGDTIGDGTSEVLRDIIAERLLGLPAERNARSGALPVTRMPRMATAPHTVIELLARYAPESPAEHADVERVRSLVASGDPWRRSTPLHVTGSALIVHPDSGRVLLRWHQRHESWLLVGGHADPEESDPLAIALREGREETGLTDLAPWPDAGVRHLVIVPVPANSREAAHEHADIRFVLATDTPDAIRPENPQAPLRWLTPGEARRVITEENIQETLSRVEPLLAD